MTNLAVVGAGFMARTHVEALGSIPGAAVGVVCAPDGDNSRALAASCSAEFTSDYSRVLADDAVDAVDLCVPTGLHADYAVAALEAGKHVLVEKPLALTLADADAVAAAAARSDRVAMVAMVLRFWPACRAALEWVRGGNIGVPALVSAQRLAPPPNWNTWMADHSRSGGPVVDLMIHDLDFTTEVLGDVDVVSGTSAHRGDHVSVLTEHAGGGVASIDASWALPPGLPLRSRFEIVGDDGSVVHEFTPGAESLTHHPPDGDPQPIPFDDADPYAVELTYFLDCIADGADPTHADIATGRNALALALSARQAIAERRRIRPPARPPSTS